MEIYLSLECRNFLISVLLGGIMAFSYDLIRVLKLLIPSIKKIMLKNFVFSFIDVFFFLVFSLITFIMIFYINSGEVRFYIFCGIFLGGVIVHYTIGNFVYIKTRKIILKMKNYFLKKTLKIKNNIV